MPPKRKKKIDPQRIMAWYTFDLAKKCDWSGELLYSIGDMTRSGSIQKEILSIPSIKLDLVLEKTNSKKIAIGSNIGLNIFITEDSERTEQAGLIDKSKDLISFSVWLPWTLANHLHMILISGRAKCLDIVGTELYKRIGSIHSISVSKDYEECCYEST